MRINAGDTAWVLASAALVLFMTPGLALFYGGMVRAKNVLGDAHAELLLHGPRQRALGRVHVLARVPRHRQVDRQLRPRVPRRTRNDVRATGFGSCRSRRCRSRRSR